MSYSITVWLLKSKSCWIKFQIDSAINRQMLITTGNALHSNVPQILNSWVAHVLTDFWSNHIIKKFAITIYSLIGTKQIYCRITAKYCLFIQYMYISDAQYLLCRNARIATILQCPDRWLYLFCHVTRSIRRVQDLVVEDRKVESEPESYRVSRLHLLDGYVHRGSVRFFWFIDDSYEPEIYV